MQRQLRSGIKLGRLCVGGMLEVNTRLSIGFFFTNTEYIIYIIIIILTDRALMMDTPSASESPMSFTSVQLHANNCSLSQPRYF